MELFSSGSGNIGMKSGPPVSITRGLLHVIHQFRHVSPLLNRSLCLGAERLSSAHLER